MSKDGEEGGRSEEEVNKERWRRMGREKGRTEVKADEIEVGKR